MGPRRNRQETAQVASGQARKTPRRRWRWRSEPSLATSHLFGRPRGLLAKTIQERQASGKRHDVESGPPNLFWLSEPIGFTALFSHPSSIRSNGRIPVFHIFRQSRVELQQGRSQFVRATGAVPLRLRISSLKLAPGEKAHFVVDSGATYDWALINQVRNDPSGRLKSMLDIPLVKGQEIPVVAKFFTDYTQPGSDPVTVRHYLSHIKGISRAELENIDDNGNILPGSGGTPSPRGITIYLASGSNEHVIKKFSKSFNIGVGSGTCDYANADADLSLNRFMNLSGNKAPMNGFRLRWKLPGDSDKIVFHEFNPRSLVESFQTGSDTIGPSKSSIRSFTKGAGVVGNATLGRVFTEVKCRMERHIREGKDHRIAGVLTIRRPNPLRISMTSIRRNISWKRRQPGEALFQERHSRWWITRGSTA